MCACTCICLFMCMAEGICECVCMCVRGGCGDEWAPIPGVANLLHNCVNFPPIRVQMRYATQATWLPLKNIFIDIINISKRDLIILCRTISNKLHKHYLPLMRFLSLFGFRSSSMVGVKFVTHSSNLNQSFSASFCF